jgi:hypothetical protein
MAAMTEVVFIFAEWNEEFGGVGVLGLSLGKGWSPRRWCLDDEECCPESSRRLSFISTGRARTVSIGNIIAG